MSTFDDLEDWLDETIPDEVVDLCQDPLLPDLDDLDRLRDVGFIDTVFDEED